MKLALTIPGGDTALNTSMATLQGRLSKVPEVCYVTGTSAASGTTYINHTLGKKPTYVSMLFEDATMSFYVSPANKLSWDATRVAVTVSTGSKNFTARIEYLES